MPRPPTARARHPAPDAGARRPRRLDGHPKCSTFSPVNSDHLYHAILRRRFWRVLRQGPGGTGYRTPASGGVVAFTSTATGPPTLPKSAATHGKTNSCELTRRTQALPQPPTRPQPKPSTRSSPARGTKPGSPTRPDDGGRGVKEKGVPQAGQRWIEQRPRRPVVLKACVGESCCASSSRT